MLNIIRTISVYLGPSSRSFFAPAALSTATASERESSRRRPRERAERPPPIQLTNRAVARLSELMASKSDAAGIRLGVKRRGCNGYSYTLNYVDKAPERDEVVSKDGVSVYVDPMATFYVVGTTMDWEETELGSEFTFKNPNVAGTCGCGESFSVDKSTAGS